MKNLFYITLILSLSSCSYNISRTGYKLDKSAANTADCDIALQKDAVITEAMEKIGEIKLKEAGFTVSCSEASALNLLKKEGCAVNASLINIIEEKRPDMLSSCYRCTAEFYRITTDSPLKTDGRFSSDKIQARAQADKNENKWNTDQFVISILAGLMEGVLLGLLRY